MLPAIVPAAVSRKIVPYAYAMVAISLALWPVAGTSPLYAALAALLGAPFVAEAHLLSRRAKCGTSMAARRPMRLFHLSNLYLAVLFLTVAAVPYLPG